MKILYAFLCLRILWFQIKFLLILQSSCISQGYVDRKLFPCGNSQEEHWYYLNILKIGLRKIPFKTYTPTILLCLFSSSWNRHCSPCSSLLRKNFFFPFLSLCEVLKNKIDRNIAVLCQLKSLENIKCTSINISLLLRPAALMTCILKYCASTQKDFTQK